MDSKVHFWSVFYCSQLTASFQVLLPPPAMTMMAF